VPGSHPSSPPMSTLASDLAAHTPALSGAERAAEERMLAGTSRLRHCVPTLTAPRATRRGDRRARAGAR
jgi:hypothetical protein